MSSMVKYVPIKLIIPNLGVAGSNPAGITMVFKAHCYVLFVRLESSVFTQNQRAQSARTRCPLRSCSCKEILP